MARIFFAILLLLMIRNINSQTSLFQTDSIYSINILENRKIQVYLPPDLKMDVSYPVILATDGQLLRDGKYNIILDSLIKNNIISPVILIAPFSNEKIIPGTNFEYRMIEYLKENNNSSNNERYEVHKYFFLKEIISFIEEKYQVKTSKEKVFYGASNGGGFGIDLAAMQENDIKHYICISPLGADIKGIKKINNPPYIYISYGKKEEEFYKSLGNEEFQMVEKKLLKEGYPLQVEKYEGGHDRALWKIEFTKYVIQILHL